MLIFFIGIAKRMYWSEACTLQRQGTRLAPAQLIAEQEPNPVVVGGSFSYSLSMPKVWHITTKLTHVHLRVVHILNPLFWIWARHVPTFLDQNTCFLRIFFCRMGGTPHPPFWEFRGIPPSTEEIHKIKFERLPNHHFVTQSVPCGSVVFEQQKK